MAVGGKYAVEWVLGALPVASVSARSPMNETCEVTGPFAHVRHVRGSGHADSVESRTIIRRAHRRDGM